MSVDALESHVRSCLLRTQMNAYVMRWRVICDEIENLKGSMRSLIRKAEARKRSLTHIHSYILSYSLSLTHSHTLSLPTAHRQQLPHTQAGTHEREAFESIAFEVDALKILHSIAASVQKVINIIAKLSRPHSFIYFYRFLL